MVSIVWGFLLPRTLYPFPRPSLIMSESHQYLCVSCYGGHVNPERARALIRNGSPITCIECGDTLAKRKASMYTVVPMNKSNYQLVTNMEILKQLNPKRTT